MLWAVLHAFLILNSEIRILHSAIGRANFLLGISPPSVYASVNSVDRAGGVIVKNKGFIPYLRSFFTTEAFSP